MTGRVYTSVLIDADNKHQAKAHEAGHGVVIGSVDLDVPGYGCIQATEPEALRNLASALTDAANQADALLRQIHAAADEAAAIHAEAEAEPGYDLDEVQS